MYDEVFFKLYVYSGAPTASDRHIGCLGNIEADSDGNVISTFTDHLATLLGDIDITGRSLVIHEGEDDLGLGGDSGVGSDWGSDSGLGDSISWGRSEVSWSWWDGGVWCWGSWDGWRGEGSGLNEVLGSSGNIGGGWLGDGLLSGNSVLVTSNNGGHSGLDGSLSNNTVLHTVLDHWRSSSVGVMSLADHSRGGGHGGAYDLSSSESSVASGGQGDCWGSHGTGQVGTGNLEIIVV